MNTIKMTATWGEDYTCYGKGIFYKIENIMNVWI